MTTVPNPSSPSFPMSFDDTRAERVQMLKPDPLTYPGGTGDPATVTAGGTKTIFDSTVNGINPQGNAGVLSGPGNLEMIQLANLSGTYDDYLTFFFDGEGSPSITMQLGHLFGSYLLNYISQAVSAVNVTAAGSGYATPPTVTISGGGGTGATATASVSGGLVTGITITNNGNGFSSPPQVTFSGGGGSGAAAYAVLNVNPQLYQTDNIGLDYYAGFGGGLGGYRVLFAPFNTSLEIVYNNPGAGAVTVFTHAVYRQGNIPYWRTGGRRKKLRQSVLGAIGGGSGYLGITNAVVPVNQYATQNLINVAGVRGELESLTFSLANFWQNYPSSSLEGHTKVYIDGVQTQEWGGTEDAFGSHFFASQLANRTRRWATVYAGPWVGVGSSGPGTVYVANRFWGKVPGDQLTFDNSVQVSWTNGQNGASSAPNQAGIAANVLYYTDH